MGWPNPSETRWACVSTKPVVEDGLTLEVSRLARGLRNEGGNGRAGRWQWSSEGAPYATISYRVTVVDAREAQLTLNFSTNGIPVLQHICLEWRPGRFGGGYWMARCPHTGLVVSKLYLPVGATRFLSRRAYRLVYRSQNECALGRASRRLHKFVARHKLGDSEMPMRPRYMRHRTFERALDRLEEYDAQWTREMRRRFGAVGW